MEESENTGAEHPLFAFLISISFQERKISAKIRLFCSKRCTNSLLSNVRHFLFVLKLKRADEVQNNLY